MPYCQYCGSQIAEGVGFCTNCGQRVVQAQSPQKRENLCPTCRSPVRFIDQYQQWWCDNCRRYCPPQAPIQPQQALCPKCGQPLSFIQQYQSWYCNGCQKYAQELNAKEPMVESEVTKISKKKRETQPEIQKDTEILKQWKLNINLNKEMFRNLSKFDIIKMEKEKDIESLIKALWSGNTDVRKQASEALRAIGDKQTITLLVDAMRYEDSDVRESFAWRAIGALGTIGDPTALESLIKALEKKDHKDAYVRSHAASALGKIGDPRAVKPLTNVLDDKDGFVRASAKAALEDIQKKQEQAEVKIASEKTEPKIVADSFSAQNGSQPTFIRKEVKGKNTYEYYKGTDAESAKEFLLTKKIDKPLYYLVVKTSEGIWGMDKEGLYLERLLPWQKDIDSAKCQGHYMLASYNPFSLNMAAEGISDNFILKVQCGKCEHRWLDGVRYQNVTIVRCPKCKSLNKVDSKNIIVISANKDNVGKKNVKKSEEKIPVKPLVEKTKEKKVKCSHCKGSGKERASMSFSTGKINYRKCSVCHGAGLVDENRKYFTEYPDLSLKNAIELIRENGKPVEINIAGNHDVRVVFKNGVKYTLGGFTIGYRGTGPGYTKKFLEAAGFDVSLDEIADMQPPVIFKEKETEDKTAKSRFNDNMDGTVTDNVMDLIWQKEEDGIRRDYKNALQYCENLNSGGYNDWRLPQKEELIKMAEFGYENLKRVFLFIKDERYWAKTKQEELQWAQNPDKIAYTVDFDPESSNYAEDKTYFRSNDYYVRAVRSRAIEASEETESKIGTESQRKESKEPRIECANCHKHFVWNEAYKCQDTPGSKPYTPPGYGNDVARVFCPHCGALVVQWHITREKDYDEWIWFGDNATLNTGCPLPPSPIQFGWGKRIPPKFLPSYDEHVLDIEKIKSIKTEKETRDKSQSERQQDWKQPFDEALKFFNGGNIKKTLELIQKAVSVGLPKREHALALGVIGEHYLVKAKDVDSAFKYLLSSIETHFSGYSKAHYYLALIYEAKGNNQKAKQEYNDAQRADPNKHLDPDYEKKVRQIIRRWAEDQRGITAEPNVEKLEAAKEVEGETVESKITKQLPKDVGSAEAYTNTKLGFSIVPPKGWNIHEPDFDIVIPSLLGAVVFYAPMGKEIKEFSDLEGLLSDGVPHIKIIVMETDMTLDELYEKSGGSSFGQLANMKVESKRKKSINDLDAYEYVATFESESDDITFCKSKDLGFVENGLAYSITFVVREEDYDRYLPVFEESIQTFQVAEQAEVSPPKQTMRDRGLGFSIDPPNGWTVFPHKPITDVGVFTIFYTTTDREKSAELEKLGSASQIGNVEIDKLGKILNDVPHIKMLVNKIDKTLDELIAEIKKIPRTSTVNGGGVPTVFLTKTVLSDRKITINDLDAYEQVYTLEDLGAVHEAFLKSLYDEMHGGVLSDRIEPQLTQRKVKESCFVERGRIFSVAFSSPKKAYESYLLDFERSIQTFHVMRSGKSKEKIDEIAEMKPSVTLREPDSSNKEDIQTKHHVPIKGKKVREERPTEHKKKCRFCGLELPIKATFCASCGKKQTDREKIEPSAQKSTIPSAPGMYYNDKARKDTERNNKNGLICGIIGIFIFGIILGPLAIYYGNNARKLDPSKGKVPIVLGIAAISIRILFILIISYTVATG